jgi:prefoldin subunit 4
MQLDDDDSNDIEVTWSDQEKINEFSRLNTRQTEAQYQLDSKREEKEQVDEVYEELEMLELNGDDDDDDDDDLGDLSGDEGNKGTSGTETGVRGGRSLPFRIGDAFVYVTLEKAVGLLDEERKRLNGEIEEWEKQVHVCDTGMKALKVELYAKFGSNISEWTR